MLALAGAVGPAGLAGAAAASAPPTVKALSPRQGLAAGGNTVVITGTGFIGTTGVRFGATRPAASFTVDSDTQITAVSPAPAVVPASSTIVNVFVDTPGGSNGNGGAAWFTYIAPPQILSMTPATSSYEGQQHVGLRVNLHGTYVDGVEVDGRRVPSVSYSPGPDPVTVFFDTAAHAVGPASVTVQTPGGSSSPSTLDYLAAPLPYVSSVSPDHGPIAGGTTVVVTGHGFTGATAVAFDSDPAASFVVSSDTQITVVTPSVPEFGPRTVMVTTPAGLSVDSRGSSGSVYAFDGPPAVSSVTPAVGPPTGGTAVDIAGRGLSRATAVRFGGVAATSWTSTSDTKIHAVAPPHSLGEVAVTVDSAAGPSDPSPSFTYAATGAPNVDALTPAKGAVTGGNTVVITGSGFIGASLVLFGQNNPPAAFTVDTDSQITAVVPSALNGTGATTVNVYVTTPSGTSANVSSSHYRFISPPSISSPAPPAGAVGTSVVFYGSGLTGLTSVTFGGIPASFSFVAGQLVVVAPPHAPGPVEVIVGGPYGSSWSPGPQFTYTAPGVPVVTSASPWAGPVVGTTALTLEGNGLDLATGVRFGATPAASWTIVDAHHITVITPPGPLGSVPITVSSAAGDSPPTVSFLYQAQSAPQVGQVWPTTGPVTGGTLVTLSGQGFVGATKVRFGYVNAPTFTVISDTQMTVLAPAGINPNATLTRIFVTTPIGTTMDGQYGNIFTYTGRPTITSLTPATGPSTGGTAVTISGFRFSQLASVRFGAVAATSVSWIDASTLVVVAPAQTPGTVDVTVAGANGTNTLTVASRFTYRGPIVTAVSPTRGPTTGGQTVIITGSGFSATTTVRFGTGPASVFAIDSDTQLTVVVPARAAPGLVNIWIVTPDGTNSNKPSSWYTYQ